MLFLWSFVLIPQRRDKHAISFRLIRTDPFVTWIGRDMDHLVFTFSIRRNSSSQFCEEKSPARSMFFSIVFILLVKSSTCYTFIWLFTHFAPSAIRLYFHFSGKPTKKYAEIYCTKCTVSNLQTLKISKHVNIVENCYSARIHQPIAVHRNSHRLDYYICYEYVQNTMAANPTD